MNPVQHLKRQRYQLKEMIEDLDIAIKEAERNKDLTLTPQQARKVMGYKNKSYIYTLDVPFSDGTITYNKLYEWAKRNVPNRLPYMRKNIKKLWTKRRKPQRILTTS